MPETIGYADLVAGLESLAAGDGSGRPGREGLFEAAGAVAIPPEKPGSDRESAARLLCKFASDPRKMPRRFLDPDEDAGTMSYLAPFFGLEPLQGQAIWPHHRPCLLSDDEAVRWLGAIARYGRHDRAASLAISAYFYRAIPRKVWMAAARCLAEFAADMPEAFAFVSDRFARLDIPPGWRFGAAFDRRKGDSADGSLSAGHALRHAFYAGCCCAAIAGKEPPGLEAGRMTEGFRFPDDPNDASVVADSLLVLLDLPEFGPSISRALKSALESPGPAPDVQTDSALARLAAKARSLGLDDLADALADFLVKPRWRPSPDGDRRKAAAKRVPETALSWIENAAFLEAAGFGGAGERARAAEPELAESIAIACGRRGRHYSELLESARSSAEAILEPATAAAYPALERALEYVRLMILLRHGGIGDAPWSAIRAPAPGSAERRADGEAEASMALAIEGFDTLKNLHDREDLDAAAALALTASAYGNFVNAGMVHYDRLWRSGDAAARRRLAAHAEPRASDEFLESYRRVFAGRLDELPPELRGEGDEDCLDSMVAASRARSARANVVSCFPTAIKGHWPSERMRSALEIHRSETDSLHAAIIALMRIASPDSSAARAALDAARSTQADAAQAVAESAPDRIPATRRAFEEGSDRYFRALVSAAPGYASAIDTLRGQASYVATEQSRVEEEHALLEEAIREEDLGRALAILDLDSPRRDAPLICSKGQGARINALLLERFRFRRAGVLKRALDARDLPGPAAFVTPQVAAIVAGCLFIHDAGIVPSDRSARGMAATSAALTAFALALTVAMDLRAPGGSKGVRHRIRGFLSRAGYSLGSFSFSFLVAAIMNAFIMFIKTGSFPVPAALPAYAALTSLFGVFSERFFIRWKEVQIEDQGKGRR